MSIADQIADVEARIETNTEAFVNNDAATQEERRAQRVELSNQIRVDTAILETLKQSAVPADGAK